MKLATTRILPLHMGKGRTESCAIADILDYAANPAKTNGGRLISSFGCDSRVADEEFILAKRPADLEALWQLLQAAGMEVRCRGKAITLQALGWQHPAWRSSLGEPYSLAALSAVLSGQKNHTP